MKVRCEHCDCDINPDTDYQRVIGYERKRGAGGTNHITLREPVPGQWSCRWCIEKLRRGMSAQQQSLLS